MIARYLRVLLWLASASAAITFVVLATSGISSPLAPDPIEATALDHAARLVQLELPYVEPTSPLPPSVMPGSRPKALGA